MQKIILYILTSLLLASCAPKKIVSSYSPEQVKSFLSNQSYQFVARYVQPQAGRQRLITGTYTLKITKDKVEADLPYFGRAYAAPIGGESGIKFSTTDFSYSANETGDGTRELTIELKNSIDVRQIFLRVYTDGSAGLSVNSNNRQTISYRGEITPLP